ncbi:MAG: pantoate--beta-alanine ligase [Planctomycetia bacterium]|jgi:pantoate--beta-alanine ligase|nr:pantoate--beta-alanine ligase [Planctomycetia bacterium]
MKRPEIVETPDRLSAVAGGTFVPTMGALHEGHLSLIRLARSFDRPVIVSIFVNPTQFGPGEDFDRYPRTMDADVELATEAGADVIYAPSAATVYPEGVGHVASVPLPPVATDPGLEDAGRPHFFTGVCEVVGRLFDQVRPSMAIFGEKDWQQLQVIRAMVASDPRFKDIDVRPGPIVRDPDGVAMSSRNAYIPEDARPRARGLVTALEMIRGTRDAGEAESTMRAVLESHSLDVEYAVIRDAETLRPPATPDRPCRAIITARLDFDGGTVRLLDNGPFPLAG